MVFNKLFTKKPTSKDIAKDRLKLVLVHDRANCSPEFLELIREELLEVLAKYIDIDQQNLDINITNGEKEFAGKAALVANIPITRMRRR